jgi:hypothetical protein
MRTVSEIQEEAAKKIHALQVQIKEIADKATWEVAEIQSRCEHKCDPNSFIYDWCIHCGEFLG